MGDLPGFDLFLVPLLLLIGVFTVLIVVEIVFVVVIRIVDGMLEDVTPRHFVTYAVSTVGPGVAAGTAGVAAGAGAAAGLGGGYVVQKWRPHVLQIQN